MKCWLSAFNSQLLLICIFSLSTAEYMRKMMRTEQSPVLSGGMVAGLFFKDSLRLQKPKGFHLVSDLLFIKNV